MTVAVRVDTAQGLDVAGHPIACEHHSLQIQERTVFGDLQSEIDDSNMAFVLLRRT
jgi:hypothetical protein